LLDWLLLLLLRAAAALALMVVGHQVSFFTKLYQQDLTPFTSHW
jgi:hypothetical protein